MLKLPVLLLLTALAAHGDIVLTTTGYQYKGSPDPCESFENPAVTCPDVAGYATSETNSLGDPLLAGFSQRGLAQAGLYSETVFMATGTQTEEFVVFGGTGAGVLVLEFRFLGLSTFEGSVMVDFFVNGVDLGPPCRAGSWFLHCIVAPPDFLPYASATTAIPFTFGDPFEVSQELTSRFAAFRLDNATLEIDSYLHGYTILGADGGAIPNALIATTPESPAFGMLALGFAAILIQHVRTRTNWIREGRKSLT